MRKVVLLGDSIREEGYGKSVASALENDFEVWQPDDNCRYAKYTLRGLYDWRHHIDGVDIIHWNNGLWDASRILDGETFTPIEQYVAEMVRLAKMLQRRAKVVIFATTTPVLEGNPNFMHNEDVDAFNAALVPQLRKLGIVIDDLNALVSEDPERYICADRTHLSGDGIAACAEQVEACIRRLAEKM